MLFPAQIRMMGPFLLGFLTPVLLPAVLQIEGGLPGIQNIRFENDPDFIGGDALTGVGRSLEREAGTWGTLISPNVILSADHYHPWVGNHITFYATNNPGGPSVTRTVIGGERIGTSDLWIGILDQSVPAEYAPYPVIAEPVTSAAAFSDSPIYNQQVLMLGRAENINTPDNLAAGFNRLDWYYPSITDSDGTTDRAIGAIEHESTDEDFVEHEAFLRPYDSGAPVLMELGGVLTLIGINWFVELDIDIDPRPPMTVPRNISGFSYVGNYADPLSDLIAAMAVDATAGYLSWMEGVFGVDSSIAQAGPALDNDLDGRNNLVEYAFNLDPQDPASLVPMSESVLTSGDNRYLRLQGQFREDPDLRYFIQAGNDLAGWSRVDLLFQDGSWSSSDAARVVLDSASSLGNGIWLLVLRCPDPLQPLSPVFWRPGVDTLPY